MPKKNPSARPAPARSAQPARPAAGPTKKVRPRSAPSAGGFVYKARSAKDLRERGEQQGGGYDSIFKGNFPVYKPKKENRLRILPPTWEDPDHYGIEIFLNYGIGPEGDKYLSLSKMKNAPDPVAEELVRAQREGEDDEYVKDLKPKKRVLVWVIDRDDEAAGPMLYDMPWTVDRDIALQCVDKRTNAVTNIDHPDEGYDIEFTKTGTKRNTEYHAFKIDRNPSPISDDPDQQATWLEYITEHPLPEVLNFYDYDHIKAKLSAGSPKRDDDAEAETEAPTRSKGKGKPEGKARKGREMPADDPADAEWEEGAEEVEEEAPARSKGKPATKGKAKPVAEEAEEEWADEAEEPAAAFEPGEGVRVLVDYDGTLCPGVITKCSLARRKAKVKFDDGDEADHTFDELLPETEAEVEAAAGEDEEWEEAPEAEAEAEADADEEWED